MKKLSLLLVLTALVFNVTAGVQVKSHRPLTDYRPLTPQEEMAAGNSPESRHATVAEIVPAIAFLLSEDSNYINGANLNVSNGSVII